MRRVTEWAKKGTKQGRECNSTKIKEKKNMPYLQKRK
jgi:hypothetical protein